MALRGNLLSFQLSCFGILLDMLLVKRAFEDMLLLKRAFEATAPFKMHIYASKRSPQL